jgi:hypothetical protein
MSRSSVSMLTRIDWFARLPGVSPTGRSVFVLSTVSGPVWAGGLSLLAEPQLCSGCAGWVSCNLTGYSAKLRDEVCVIARRFAVQLLQTVQDCFNAVNRGQDKSRGLTGDRHAVAKFAH